MANTHRGWISVGVAAGVVYGFDQFASMIGAGSAIGGWYLGASAAFPRASQLHTPTFTVDAMLFRYSGAGSVNWSSDPVGTPNASVGIAMFGNDPKPIPFPGEITNFRVAALSAGTLNIIFLEGDALEL